MSFIPAASEALDVLTLEAETSHQNATRHGITATPSGYFYAAGKRVGLDRAIELIAESMAADACMSGPAPRPADADTIANTDVVEGPRQPKRTGFTWESLNEATQAVFWRLAEQIQTATQDADQLQNVRLGHDIPKVELVDAPRITNLKKAGLLETFEGVKRSHRHIRLTDAGRVRWQTGA
ncbi:hypothetical protein [Cyanobium sp. N5-Cardenillas]|uniref:hypothetical protein n=1 Tax=Cyanobium sp. N5-Cardenillas TaxID=2823720 RepID=UPI0020CBF196|nr:hypothetical protein [Cyanobium sp. N5-Cardenillas]MCP9786003.1 hypothetical protein [Cyanobium sp. N5-Cardenillas]